MLTKIFNLLLPPTCILCGDRAKQAIDLCKPCQQELPWLDQVCQYCALPLANATTCGSCLHKSPPFNKTLALWHYQYPVDHFITHLKFNHQLVYARLLGELLAQRLVNYYQQDNLPDCIIPVPLHTKRLQERGFNQALEIARPIAKKLKLPLDFNSCHRTRATEAQSALPAKQRHHNVKDAFVVSKNLQGKHIALIDDVITTGHTVTELSTALRKAGVAQIDVWCCARTSVIKE